MSQGIAPTTDFVSRDDVLRKLQTAPAGATVKEIGRMLGLDMTIERNIKAISNRCGYLIQMGQAVRVGKGTYQYQERKHMETFSVTEIQNGDVAQAANPDVTCKVCGFEARSPMGLTAHNTRNHKPKSTPDQLFERVGLACEMLFPEGIPMARIIEIAELQKAMLKVLSR